MRSRVAIFAPYLLLGVVVAALLWLNFGRGSPAEQRAADAPLRDPVCNMDVNASWGISAEVEGVTYSFCTENCREKFVAHPEKYVSETCLVCDKVISRDTALPATYLGKTYYLCGEEHRRTFQGDPAAYFMHHMWGIPDWLYYASIAIVLLLSFLVFEQGGARAAPDEKRAVASIAAWLRGGLAGLVAPLASFRSQSAYHRRASGSGFEDEDDGKHRAGGSIALPVLTPASRLMQSISRRSDTGESSRVARVRADRIDLLDFRLIRVLAHSRCFRFFLQALMAAIFVVIIAAGLFGNQNPSLNIAPLLTWTIWWCGLVILIMFAGKAWCYVCPWDAIAGWTERLRFWKKSDDGLGLNLKWPRALRNIWLATFLFVGLTWIELGFGVTMRPEVTAWIAVGMLIMAIVSAFLFDRKSFCRYGCLVGRVSGLYALFAGAEVRARDADVCRTCKTKECIKGSETAYGCPTFEYPGAMQSNTYCIQCCECIQACPHENMTINMRPWGSDLANKSKPRSDEAYLALLMLAISGFHGLTMTPVWRQMTDAIGSAMPIGQMASFSLGMIGLMTAPIGVYALLLWISHRLSRTHTSEVGAKSISYRDYFVRYSYCVLPIALFYHLAHNMEHLMMDGPKVIAMMSDPFGWNWNLFGTAHWTVPPIISLDVLWIFQVLLVGIGHVYSLWAASRITGNLFEDRRAARRGQWPILLGMIAFSIFSLWLLKQPMEMRTSAM